MATSSSSAPMHQGSENVSQEPPRKNTLEVVPEITPSETPVGDDRGTTPTKNRTEISNTTEDMDKLVTALQTPPNREIANASISISSGTTIDPTRDGENRLERAQNEKQWNRPCSDMRWNVSCFAMFVGAILYGLDTTIAADVQGPILKSLGNIEKLAWVGIGFPMGAVAVILLMGSSYGLFEIKGIFIAGRILFSIGSALCGAAPTMDVLIIGRVIAGIGGASAYLGALTYITKFASPKEQPLYNGLVGICWGVGTILGPVVGGSFSESSATWRWAFYVNLPITAVFAPVYLFVFPKYNPMPELSAWKKLKSMDWVGALLNAIIFTLFQVILTFAGSIYPWNSTIIITLISIFGASLVAFMIQQTFCIFTTKERRLFPVQFLRNRAMVLLFNGTAAAAAGLGVTLYYVPLFFQFTRGDSALQAAVRILPLICMFVVVLIFSSVYLPSYGRYQPFYVVAGVLITVGGAMMHTVKASTSKSYIYGYEVLIAVGIGLINQTGYTIGVLKVKEYEIPSALGFMNVAQIGTAAIALSMADCIFQNVGFHELKHALASYRFTDKQIRSALAGSESDILSVNDPVFVRAVVNTLADVVGKLWWMVMAAGIVSLVSGIFMSREKVTIARIDIRGTAKRIIPWM